jgi:hypothetical protein
MALRVAALMASLCIHVEFLGLIEIIEAMFGLSVFVGSTAFQQLDHVLIRCLPEIIVKLSDC